MELISNRHLSSKSGMKCRYVGGKYMHFMTANRVLAMLLHRTSTHEGARPGEVEGTSQT
jgi:hypothetical protein